MCRVVYPLLQKSIINLWLRSSVTWNAGKFYIFCVDIGERDTHNPIFDS